MLERERERERGEFDNFLGASLLKNSNCEQTIRNLLTIWVCSYGSFTTCNKFNYVPWSCNLISASSYDAFLCRVWSTKLKVLLLTSFYYWIKYCNLLYWRVHLCCIEATNYIFGCLPLFFKENYHSNYEDRGLWQNSILTLRSKT